MFHSLRDFNIILVTGPQRAGTTITAKMIAHDTGLPYRDEQAFRATDTELWRQIVEDSERAVIQCPGMCRWVHEYGHRDDVLVVLMRRDIEDIIASQRRIGWGHEQFELANYGDFPRPGEPISAVKYRYFFEHQAGRIKNYEQVNYADIRAHPLYISKAERAHFHARQTA